ncbi:hypothetical protein [Burkholderia sp. F1]|uniref:hypothetical protein n=1 Tax=Burkholderia sp. F1 TaxID=3366817 RepID=UPI003D71AEEC
MPAPAPADMLAAWERGATLDAVERGLILLSLACPGWPADALLAASIGERDRRLLALRAAMFGAHLSALASCDACGEPLELDVPIGDLLAASAQTAGDAPTALTWQDDDGIEWRLRVPDSGDLRAAAHAGDGIAATHALMRRCIVSARLGGECIEIRALPDDMLDDAAQHIEVADPYADLRLASTCSACGAHWQAPLDIASYLWAELDAWAARMVWEIHTLASVYGWRESDVLSLGPARRAAYLNLVLG